MERPAEARGRIRYSVLLPTRNGGPFLEDCLQSVLTQDHASFEVVVCDNANEDATPAILRRLAADERIVRVRHDTLLSVTENWRSALAASSGDYVLMIGDDDLLLPGALDALDRLLDASDGPDCVSFDAFRYVAPGAVAGRTVSFYGSPYFGYAEELRAERFLSAARRERLVRDAFDFKFRFPLTMQLTLVKRTAMARLAGGPFQSAFPDHYALCGLLLTAERWSVTDQQLLVIGVSPKSFGHYFLNGDDGDGLRYLGLPTHFAGRLPGNEVLNAQCDWLAVTKAAFSAQLAGTDIDRGAYVARQVRHWLREYRRGTIAGRTVLDRFRLLTPRDLAATARRHCRPAALRAVARAVRDTRRGRTVYLDRELTPLPNVTSIAGFASWLEARRLTPSHAGSARRTHVG